MISKISVKNVKGIEDWSFSFTQPEMNPNKVHLLIAPNGFGKSSITRAFDCLNNVRLNLKEKDCYCYNEENLGELSLSCHLEDGEQTLTANQNQNLISKKFDTWVIRSPNKVKATQRSTGSGFQVPVGEFVIEDIELRKIPAKFEIPYKFRECCSQFGTIGKVMPNLSSHLRDHRILENLLNTNLGKKKLGVIAKRRIEKALLSLQELSGKKVEILNLISHEFFEDFDDLKEVSDLFPGFNSVGERYLAAIQILYIHHQDIANTKKAAAWRRAEDDFRRVKETILAINPNQDWLQPNVQRTKGKIVISLPKPDQMSNGQRDFLCFVANLLKFEIHNKRSRRILIIDEVFDYLDYSNIVACQYYLKKFIDHEKAQGRELYLWVFTHLDPSVFNSFIFSKKIQKNHFLDKATSVDNNKGICKIIRIRDSFEELKNIFDVYYAHFSPEDCMEKDLFEKNGLKKNWGCSKTFKKYCEGQAALYIAGSSGEVDFLAVCLHVRVKIERDAFCRLDESQQAEFLGTKKTLNKLDKAQEFGAEIPELHYLLAGLMNTALHDTNPNVDFVSPVVTKLRNQNIKAMVKEVLKPSS